MAKPTITPWLLIPNAPLSGNPGIAANLVTAVSRSHRTAVGEVTAPDSPTIEPASLIALGRLNVSPGMVGNSRMAPRLFHRTARSAPEAPSERPMTVPSLLIPSAALAVSPGRVPRSVIVGAPLAHDGTLWASVITEPRTTAATTTTARRRVAGDPVPDPGLPCLGCVFIPPIPPVFGFSGKTTARGPPAGSPRTGPTSSRQIREGVTREI